MNNVEGGQPLLNLILTAVALAMGVASVVLNILDADASTNTLLGIGLAALALSHLVKLRT